MKQIIVSVMLALLPSMFSFAQKEVKKGACGEDVSWSFNGSTLTLTSAGKGKVGTMTNYDMGKHRAPWTRQGLNIQEVVVEKGIGNIGACAFAGCKELRRVEFESQTDLTRIGWGAFMGCTALADISLPSGLRDIGALAFARCTSLSDISIPDYCGVGELAFASCNQLRTLTCGPSTKLQGQVFTCEKGTAGHVLHTPWKGTIIGLPNGISTANCLSFGLEPESVERFLQSRLATDTVNDLRPTAKEVDEDIPDLSLDGNKTYAIIIGNQNYRLHTGMLTVPFARHDAEVFKSYLGLPNKNVRLLKDATKHEMEVEFTDWVNAIENREDKTLIVYYAGHGLPKTEEDRKTREQKEKACLIPVDVADARHGILLDNLYKQLGDAGFSRVAVFLDACFSGASRVGNSVYEDERGGALRPSLDPTFGNGRVVAFAAASADQAAQSYTVKQHGLFTYHLLKGLKETKGDIDFGTLAEHITREVEAVSAQRPFRPQTPTVSSSNAFRDDWKTIKLKQSMK